MARSVIAWSNCVMEHWRCADEAHFRFDFFFGVGVGIPSLEVHSTAYGLVTRNFRSQL